MDIENCFENGLIFTSEKGILGENITYMPHPKFKGVFLKHLVTGEFTDNKISCHLVKVEPFCTLDAHVHENCLEVHEIIAGDGTCFIGENEVNYCLGSIGVIPSNTPHKVKAGSKGIYILAKFAPALL